MIKEIVAAYAAKGDHGVEVNLKALARDEEFRKEVIKAVVSRVECKDGKPSPCVVIPAFDSGATDNHLGQLINELALNLQVKTLVTGKVENFKCLRTHPKEVLIIKQSFRAGEGLKNQIAALKALGAQKVGVLCFIAHNTARMQGFGHENEVEIEALVKTDEIRYLE